MWISKATAAMLVTANAETREAETFLHQARGENTRLEIENTRLRADLDWFKHRLNQCERERGQLIQAAIGVKISVPEFVPTAPETDQTLHAMPSFASVGGDALPEGVAVEAGEDYSGMPGYKKDK